jgi:hypothetical protein
MRYKLAACVWLVVGACGGRAIIDQSAGADATGSGAGEQGGSSASGGSSNDARGGKAGDASASPSILNPKNCPNIPSAELSACSVTAGDISCSADDQCTHLILPSCNCLQQDVGINKGSVPACKALACGGAPSCNAPDLIFETQDCVAKSTVNHASHCVDMRCVTYAVPPPPG